MFNPSAPDSLAAYMASYSPFEVFSFAKNETNLCNLTEVKLTGIEIFSSKIRCVPSVFGT